MLPDSIRWAICSKGPGPDLRATQIPPSVDKQEHLTVSEMVDHQEDVTDPRTTTVLQEKDEEQYITSETILKGAQKATEEEHGMSLL